MPVSAAKVRGVASNGYVFFSPLLGLVMFSLWIRKKPWKGQQYLQMGNKKTLLSPPCNIVGNFPCPQLTITEFSVPDKSTSCTTYSSCFHWWLFPCSSYRRQRRCLRGTQLHLAFSPLETNSKNRITIINSLSASMHATGFYLDLSRNKMEQK